MKIMHVHLSGEFAGSERYCATLASGQAAAGDRVLVVVRESPVVARWKAEAAPAEVVVVPRWVPSFLQAWVVGKFIRGFEPEVVHTHLGRANIRGGKAARKAGVPWVVTVHLRWKEKEMAGASGAICVAGWQKREIPEGFGGLVGVVWNWIGHRAEGIGQRKRELGAALALRGGWGCGEGTMVFGSVGRLHGQKGMDVLVRAFREAFKSGEDVRLVIVGEGDKRKELEALADDARVVFAGYQERVEDYYAAFDVYVSAARYEPFGLTILEAMAAGKPLICTKTEGPVEFLAEAEVAWAEKGDVPSLAAALRAEYFHGKRMVPYEMEVFSLGRGVGEVREFYRKVLGEADGGRDA